MKRKTRNSLIALFLTFVLFVAAVSQLTTGLASFAESEHTQWNGDFVGYSEGLDFEQVHEETVLYGNVNEDPSITVLIHGQGGSASHWSNAKYNTDYNTGKDDEEEFLITNDFTYDEESLVEVLRNQAGGADVYLVSATSKYVDHDPNEECPITKTKSKYKGACGYCRTQLSFKLRKMDIPDFSEIEKNESEENEKNSPSRKVGDYVSSEPLQYLPSVDKHIILVFEGSEGAIYNSHWVFNDELHYALDKISFDYKALTGKIPVMNLIAHSRGGISAVSHAAGYTPGLKLGSVSGELNTAKNSYSHKFNVKDVFTMGSPFFGTKLEDIGNKIMPGSIDNYSGQDILDEGLQKNIRNNWNSAVKENENLQLYPIAGKVDLNFLIGMVIEDMDTLIDFLNRGEGGLSEAYVFDKLKLIINYVILGVEAIKYLCVLALERAAVTVINVSFYVGGIFTVGALHVSNALLLAAEAAMLVFGDLTFGLLEAKNETSLEAALQKLCSVLDRDYFVVEPLIELLASLFFGEDIYTHFGDMFIDLNSQLAQSEDGDYDNVPERFIKDFTYIDLDVKKSGDIEYYNRSFDLDKKSLINVGIPHNLETRDNDIIAYIARRINLGKPTAIFNTTSLPDNTLKINGYNFQSMGNGGNVSAVLPSVLNVSQGVLGVPVKELGDKAFEGCTSLRKIILPSILNGYGNNVFNGTALSEIALQETVYDKSMFEAISPKYRVIDNVLYEIEREDDDGTELKIVQIPLKGKLKLDVNTVKTDGKVYNIVGVAPYACFGSELRNVEVSYSGTLKSIGEYAFANTPFFDNNNGLILVDNFVVGYNGKESELNINDASCKYIADKAFSPIESSPYDNIYNKYVYSPRIRSVTLGANIIGIGDFAFYNNKTLQQVDLSNSKIQVVSHYAFADCRNLNNVVLSSETVYIMAGAFSNCKSLEKFNLTAEVSAIGSDAFLGCSSLKEFSILRFYPATLGQNAFNDCSNLTIYVPYEARKIFEDSINWRNYANKFDTKAFSLSFETNGGYGCEPLEIGYYQYLSNLPTPIKSGYSFVGWKDKNGDFCKEATLWDLFGDASLYAVWEINEYIIIYETYGVDNDNPVTYTVESGAELHSLKKPYNKFAGWYDNPKFEGDTLSEVPKGTTGTVKLYARWIPKQTTITDENGNNIVKNGTTIGYGENYSLEVPVKDSYIFEGWYYDGIRFTDSNGSSLIEWDKPIDSFTMTAKWRSESYVIRLDSNGETLFINGDGIQHSLNSVLFGNVSVSSEDIIRQFISSGLSVREGHIFITLVDANGKEISWMGSIPDLGSDSDAFKVSPKWEKEIYTFNFIEYRTQKALTYGDSLTNLPIPERKGYTFVGWEVVSVYSADFDYVGKIFKSEERAMQDLTLGLESSAELDVKAVWTPNKYRVDFNYGDYGYREVVFGSFEMEVPSPTRKGYNFVGWYVDSTEYFNANGIMTRSWDIDEDTVLTAKWNAIRYEINYYDIQGGEALDNGTYTIEESFALKTPSKYMYRFNGWYNYDTNEPVPNIPVGSTGNIRLKASWLGNEITLNDKISKKYRLEDSVLIVHLKMEAKRLIVNNNYQFTIASSVNEITFIGYEKSLVGNFIIEDRINPLVIRFKSVYMTAPTGYDAISLNSAVNLIVEYDGANTIVGGVGASAVSAGDNGCDGKSAIYSPNAYLTINKVKNTDSNLNLIGGNGADGKTGATGIDGLKGEDGKNVKTTRGDATAGKQGGDGGVGGQGGDGGNGGNAVVARSCNYNSTVSACGGNGGNGGAGGIGGRGGAGGNGGSDNDAGKSGKPANGGNGGRGGNGGDGGAGGDGAYAFCINGNLNGSIGFGGTGGIGGSGGEGGSGGIGGDAGIIGKDADNGSEGSKGKKGVAGLSGFNAV